MTLVGVEYLDELPYDMPLRVNVTIAHNSTMMPSVTIYYAVLSPSQIITSGGWHLLPPELSISNPAGNVTTYKFSIPFRFDDDGYPYRSEIVFYVEAIDAGGNRLLTASSQDRWDPLLQDDKFSVEIMDPYPPVIGSVSRFPILPNEDAPVTVTANVTDYGSGVKEVLLIYSEEDLVSHTLLMNQTGSGMYEGQIPPSAQATKIAFLVAASDNAGNEAASKAASYRVASGTTPDSSRYILSGIILAAAMLALIGIWMIRRGSGGVIDVRALRPEHPKAMTALLVFILCVAAWLYYVLVVQGAPILALIEASALILGWGLIDPRFDLMIFPKRAFNRAPATSVIAEAYVLGLATAIGLAGGYLFNIYSTAKLYSLALTVAPYVLLLFLVGMFLQLAWPYLKEIDVSLQIEHIRDEQETD